jgi:predicted porin
MPGGEISAGNLVIKGEYVSSTRKDSAAIDEDNSAYYVEAYYTFLEKYTPYVRYENYKPEDQTKDANDTTFGITYHLRPWLSQIKAQVRAHKDDTVYYNEYGIGIALGF